MKFSRVYIKKDITTKKNLGEINLTQKPLGSTVALIGKNGAGKSRVLEYVSNYLDYLTPELFIKDHITNIPERLKTIAPQIWISVEQTKNKVAKLNPDQKHSNNATYANYLQQAGHATDFIKRYGKIFIKVVDTDDIKNVKNTISQGFSFEQILQNSHLSIDPSKKEQLPLNEFQEFNNNQVVDYLTGITNGLILQEFNLYLQHKGSKELSENMNLVSEKMSEMEIFNVFSRFQHYIKLFLGKDFSYQSLTKDNMLQSVLYYNQQPFKLENFSPGQRTLFAYAVLFFYLDISSGTDLKDCIIFVDEPELHLHPEAQIKLIDALRRIISENGQLWIATHSINILSHLNYDEILMVKDDEIILPSRLTPGNSYSELMELEDHMIELQQFITSINEWSYSNFMLQCFKNPEVIFHTDKNDPQYILFKEFLKKKDNIALLDFGAGKGRMGHTISDDRELNGRISYSAFEPNSTHHKSLNEIPNIFNITSKSSETATDSIDIVLLCNVLHEISPKNWISVFVEIKRILRETGYLIIIEDANLPKGEIAHEYGYLLLNNEQLAILLNQDSLLQLQLKDAAYKDRIIFSIISKNEIDISPDGIFAALKDLEKSSYRKIKALRRTVANIADARVYANYTQLNINSRIALEDMELGKL